MSDDYTKRSEDVDGIVIPDGTQLAVVGLDIENESVQVEFSVDGRVMRAWVPAAMFEKILMN